jgi:hypothetical protein
MFLAKHQEFKKYMPKWGPLQKSLQILPFAVGTSLCNVTVPSRGGGYFSPLHPPPNLGLASDLVLSMATLGKVMQAEV